MEMTGVETQKLFARDRITQVKFMRANHITFRANAKELGFDRVEIERGIDLVRKNRVKRLCQKLTRPLPIRGRVFRAIWDPDVGHAGRAECFSKSRTDSPAGDAVVDPELANGRIAMGEGVTRIGFGMRKKSGVEIEADFLASCPVDPCLKMSRLERIAIDFVSTRLGIARMQIQTMPAGNERQSLFNIRSQFIRRPRLAGKISRDGKTTSQRQPRILKSSDVVALPAVQRNGNGGKALHRPLNIDAALRVVLGRDGKRLFGDLLAFGHGSVVAIMAETVGWIPVMSIRARTAIAEVFVSLPLFHCPRTAKIIGRNPLSVLGQSTGCADKE